MNYTVENTELLKLRTRKEENRMKNMAPPSDYDKGFIEEKNGRTRAYATHVKEVSQNKNISYSYKLENTYSLLQDGEYQHMIKKS